MNFNNVPKTKCSVETLDFSFNNFSHTLVKNLETKVTYTLIFFFYNNIINCSYVSIEYPVVLSSCEKENNKYMVALYTKILYNFDHYLVKLETVLPLKKASFTVEMHKFKKVN